MFPLSLLGAVLLSAVLIATMLAGRWHAGSPRPAQLLAWPGGVALAFLVGAVIYSGHPRWPITENEDRFLAILLPFAASIEMLPLLLKRGLVWPGRLLVAATAVPILLFGSAYFQTWTTAESCLWIGGLAASFLLGWVSLDLQIRSLPPRTVLLGLAGVNAGAGIVLMIAGYASGGPFGIILGVVLASAALVTPRSIPTEALTGAASIGLVGLFALLASGHFFASLGLDHAAILWATPFVAWALIRPQIRKVAIFRLAILLLEALPVLGAAGLAWRRSEEPQQAPRPVQDDGGYSPADYEQFGK